MSNPAKIKERIEVLRQKMNNASVAELEKGGFEGDERLLGNGVISGWYDKTVDWTSDKLDKFLKHYNINPAWWRTGKGEVFNEKHAYVEIPTKKESPYIPGERETFIENTLRMGRIIDHLLEEIRELKSGSSGGAKSS